MKDKGNAYIMIKPVIIKGVDKKNQPVKYTNHSQSLFSGNRIQKKTIFEKLKNRGQPTGFNLNETEKLFLY